MKQDASVKSPIKQTENPIYNYVLIGFIFIFQFYSKSREVNTPIKPELKSISNKLFWKYIILFQLANSINNLITGFNINYFQTYQNISKELIPFYQSLPFFSASFIGVYIVSFSLRKQNLKITCILYGIFSFIAIVLRTLRNAYTLALSQIIFGISFSCLIYGYENWFVYQANSLITDHDAKSLLLSNAFEKVTLCDGIITFGVNFIANIIKNEYGYLYLHLISAFVSLLTIILTQIFIEDTNIKHKDNEVNLKGTIGNIFTSIKVIIEQKNFLLLGVIEIVILSSFHIFGLLWEPMVRNLNPQIDLARIVLLLMMGMMAGTTAFRVLYDYYNKDNIAIISLIGFLGVIGFSLIIFKGDYSNSFTGALCYQVAIGIFYPNNSFIQAEWFPNEISIIIGMIFKVPFLLFKAYTILKPNILSKSQMRFGILGIFIVVLLISFCFKREKKEQLTQKVEKEKKKKKTN